jgi:hypothetical protein
MKIARLLKQRDGHKAFVMYVCALGWSGGHGTDGQLPAEAFPFVHGSEKLADLLVEAGLIDRDHDGYVIRNYAERQELAAVSEAKHARKVIESKRMNCVRWHGKECGCWER